MKIRRIRGGPCALRLILFLLVLREIHRACWSTWNAVGAKSFGLLPQKELHLVVSFWAPSLKPVPHRAETEAAIALNTANPYISTVHVFLEATIDFHCSDVESRVEGLLQKAQHVRQAAELDCHEQSAQLSFFDMFLFAKSVDAGDSNRIVILANADMVFDSTVVHLRGLNPSVLAIIATRGFGSASGTRQIRKFYRTVMKSKAKAIPNRCYNLHQRGKKECRGSWDAYAFEPSRLKLSLTDFLDERSGRPFVMHQNGADPSALNALLTLSHFNHVHQLCDYVKMWHYHSEGKTHFNNSEMPVFHEYSFPAECATVRGCLNPSSDATRAVDRLPTPQQKICDELHAPFRNNLTAFRKGEFNVI
uniref:Uncharacterized protein n=1 Tax=Micromonas pusilla TaxID=38833 RepID=A0A6U0GXB3_MICPS|mmetsp:Transcript_15061/g.54288  ORF Transcript_15061/g.54288 Transcript_15061/m.54288 type:complete len:363 (+) Transcript_15061:174-1262(+)